MEKKPQNKIAPIHSQGEVKKPRQHFNSLEAQRQRLLDWLRVHGMISTLTARSELDILAPQARIFELRHKFGLLIDLVWVDEPTDCGRVHRVGMYVLRSVAEGV